VLLINQPRDPDFRFPVQQMLDGVNALFEAAGSAQRTLWRIKSQEKRDENGYASVLLRKLDDVAHGILTALESEEWKLVNERSVLVTGAAGVGKSHLFGDAVDYQISQSCPAVLILG
jgi:DNA replication protein DnaC